MIWITSDLHIGHANIVKWRPQPDGSPYSTVEAHNEFVYAQWRSVVASDDVVIIIGDAVMGKRADSLASLRALPGWKILVPGNHDTLDKQYDEYARSFDWIHRYRQDNTVHLSLADNAPIAVCSHYPLFGTPDHDDIDRDLSHRYPKAEDIPADAVFLHGHTHSNERFTKHESGVTMCHVGFDAWMRPVTYDEILKGKAAFEAEVSP